GFIIPFISDEQEWSVEFNPLAQESSKDKAEILEKNVNSIAALIASGAMDTNEARDTLRTIAPEIKISDGDIEPKEPVQEAMAPTEEPNE
ncbi:TPA: hypothetical protein ACWZ7Z_004975, partial [Escherichia coli]